MIDPAAPLTVAQYGTKHAHAAGWLRVMLDSRDARVAGVYEPDAGRRARLEASGDPPWAGVRWFSDPAEFLDDPDVVAVAAEGANVESLEHAEQIVAAGKHLLLDKPAGDDFPRFQRLVADVQARGLHLQLGYMFRHHDGFQRMATWAREGFLGDVFAVRAHMSTYAGEPSKRSLAAHRGGVFYDLAGHVLDQIVWTLGRPSRVHPFMQRVERAVPNYVDNGVAVLAYDRALAIVDIAGLETRPPARRYEVYGTKGSAIMEPYEPADTLRLCLDEPRQGHPAGVSTLALEARPRYVASLAAFVRTLRGEQPPDRGLDHELLVQETLLRATGSLPE